MDGLDGPLLEKVWISYNTILNPILKYEASLESALHFIAFLPVFSFLLSFEYHVSLLYSFAVLHSTHLRGHRYCHGITEVILSIRAYTQEATESDISKSRELFIQEKMTAWYLFIDIYAEGNLWTHFNGVLFNNLILTTFPYKLHVQPS
jgi:hypothetical protein